VERPAASAFFFNRPKWQYGYRESIKNKVAVINFWFINCKGCIAEFPALNNLAGRYKDEDVAFLGMALDNVDSLKSFLKKRAFDFKVLSRSGKFAEQLSVDAYPTSIVVDGNGVIKELFVGGMKNIDERVAGAIDRIRKK
jgi:peroxiredoxin